MSSAVAAALVCPICRELLSDPLVAPCGHAACAGCARAALAARALCWECRAPTAADSLVPCLPLQQAAARLHAAAAPPPPPASDPAAALRAALDTDAPLDAATLDAAVAELTSRRAAAAAAGEAADLRLLRRFLADARARKAARLDALRAELAAVDVDMALVAATADAAVPQLEAGDAPAAAAAARLAPLLMPAPAACDGEASGGSGRGRPRRRRRGAASPDADATSADAATTTTTLATVGHAAAAAAPPLAVPAGLALADPAAARAAKRRVAAQFADLHEAYLSLRGKGGGGQSEAGADGPPASGLAEFSRVLAACLRAADLTTVATLTPPRAAAPGAGGGGGGACIVSSLDFDASGARFASAGVSRRVAVFDFDAVVAAAAAATGRGGGGGGADDDDDDAPSAAPVAELASRAKLSCAVWAPAAAAAPHTLLATDYDGCATLWDVASAAVVAEYDAHDRRVWSADWSPAAGGGAGPGASFATASDDGTAKLWSVASRAPALTLDVGANVCCVAYAPARGGVELAVGAADHAVRVYDVRAPAAPLATLAGHRKAVSYVRYARGGGVVSASTDSTLRLWPATGWAGEKGDAAAAGPARPPAARVFRGHANERHFVGLAVAGDLLACGSETGDVCVYHASMARPVARRAVGGGGPEGGAGGEGAPAAASPRAAAGGAAAPHPFVSAVTWRPGTGTLLAASSLGVVHVLALAGGEET